MFALDKYTVYFNSDQNMGEPNRLKKVAKKKKGDHSGKGITKDPGKSDVRGKAIKVESKSKGPFIKVGSQKSPQAPTFEQSKSLRSPE